MNFLLGKESGLILAVFLSCNIPYKMHCTPPPPASLEGPMSIFWGGLDKMYQGDGGGKCVPWGGMLPTVLMIPPIIQSLDEREDKKKDKIGSYIIVFVD